MSQDLAVRQLADLAGVSDSTIEILGSTELDSGAIAIDMSLDTSGIETANGGISVRDRERFKVVVTDRFPHVPPSVFARHRRWAGTSHVQWGSYLCLYAATAVEWNPSDGMRGLIQRLTLWLERAAAGTLDPDGQPLHPPVTYASDDAGLLVVRADVGDRVPWQNGGPDATSLMYAWCVLDGDRFDVLEWLDPPALYARVLEEPTQHTDEVGHRHVVAPLFLVSSEIAFEYPRSAAELVEGLSELGITRDRLLAGVTIAGTANRITSAPDEPDQFPVIALIGTPSRRGVGSRRLPHLSAWRFDDLGEQIAALLRTTKGLSEELNERVRSLANDWLSFAKVRWMTVHEDRPEVTNRRDADTAAAWLHGKRVLVLGCGALGAPIAEQCARAGVAGLTVADHGVVKPGLLVRQPYADGDIGHSKARVLAARLSDIRRDLTVTPLVDNVLDMFTGDADAPLYDLVIDATAHIGVRTALEAARARQRDAWPPVICGLFGHDATRAIGILSRPGAAGGPHDVLRRVAIDARGRVAGKWSDIANDIFPDPPRTDRFFPEPGCSEPTFTGGATQTEALASWLLWAALHELSVPAAEQEPMVAFAVRLNSEASAGGPSRLSWPDDIVVADTSGYYEIRISQRALAEMRAEVRRGARTRGPDYETGGMLLGSFDDAVGCVYVDVAAAPSADSVLSPMYFGHGTEGTQEVVDHHRERTARRVGFVGMWHTHPGGPARPSPIDLDGMDWLVSPDGTGRRALMMILGGDDTDWSAWRDNGTVPNAYVEVVDRTAIVDEPTRHTARVPAVVISGRPGGYYQPEPAPAAPWWRRLWRQE